MGRGAAYAAHPSLGLLAEPQVSYQDDGAGYWVDDDQVHERPHRLAAGEPGFIYSSYLIEAENNSG